MAIETEGKVKDRTKKKRKRDHQDDADTTLRTTEENGGNVSVQEKKKKKEKRKSEDVDDGKPASDAKSKKSDKELSNLKRGSHKKRNATSMKTVTSNTKKRIRYKKKQAVNLLLKQRSSVGCEQQVKRIQTVTNDISYHDLMDELIQKLKTKAAKRLDYQRDGKEKKIEKMDKKVKKYKKEAIDKASEVNSNALKDLLATHKAIIRKMKKKKRTKSFALGGMAKEKANLGLKCQDGVATLQQKSLEARAQVTQATEEAKEALQSKLKTFTQKVEEIDVDNLALELEHDPAFSGAVYVKGYLC